MLNNNDEAIGTDKSLPDINITLRQALTAVMDLSLILEQETAALKASQTSVFLELQDQKMAAAQKYEGLVSSLMSYGADIKNADPRLKERLQTMQSHFSVVLTENLKWMEQMKQATQRLGSRIMLGARKSLEKQTQGTYGSTGKMQNSGKAIIGLDERV